MQSISSRSSISLSGRRSAAAAGKTRRGQQQQRAVVVAKASANNDDGNNSVSLGRRLQQAAMSVAAGAVIATAPPSMARLEGVNNPQMLPAGPPQEVLDVAGTSSVLRFHSSHLFSSGEGLYTTNVARGKKKGHIF